MERTEQLKLLKDMKNAFVEKYIKETHRMKNLCCNSTARQTLLLYANNIMGFYECFVRELQTIFAEE